MRSGPGTSNPVAFTASRDEPLRVKGRSDSWLHVETRDGRLGWIAGWLVNADFSVSAEDFDLRAATPVRAAPPPVVAAPAPAVATPAPSGGGSVVGRLKKLKSLYDQGLITQEDYDAKRKQILDSL